MALIRGTVLGRDAPAEATDLLDFVVTHLEIDGHTAFADAKPTAGNVAVGFSQVRDLDSLEIQPDAFVVVSVDLDKSALPIDSFTSGRPVLWLPLADSNSANRGCRIESTGESVLIAPVVTVDDLSRHVCGVVLALDVEYDVLETIGAFSRVIETCA